MAVVTPPFVQQGGSHPAATFREMLLAATMSPAAAFAGGIQATTAGGGHGVVGAGDLAVAQNGTPNMSVNVAAGSAFVRGTEALAQGVYAGFNDATTNLVVSAADPTNPRKDLVVLRVRDAFYSGGSTDVSLAVITGTAAASPVDPTVPANSLVIARITVAAAVTSILNAAIADLRTFATALGGIQRTTSSFRPSGASLFEGLWIDESDTDKLLRYDGAAWTLPKNLPAGTVPGGYAQITANQTGITTLTDVTGLTVTFTAEAGRRYRITGSAYLLTSVAGDVALLTIADGASAQLQSSQVDLRLSSTDVKAHVSHVLVPGAGSKTYKLRAGRVSGSGNISVDAGASYPAYILVEDIGT